MSPTGLRPPLGVIGLSARMLAVSAARAGYRPIAIDLFADQDTREVAHAVAVGSLTECEILPVLRDLPLESGKPMLVYGGGIDTRPDLLEKISESVDLIGNPVSVLRDVHDPRKFFRILDYLGIPYPEICFERPADPDSWLFKVPFTEGGKGVLPAFSRTASLVGYYQKKLAGPTMSVLFLANRAEARIIGFNTQWTTGAGTQTPYLFSGIMNSADLEPEQKKRVCEYVAKLVKSLSLAGLNSLDFMVEGDHCEVLELNPRPGASMVLYDHRFPQGLLKEHINAVKGREIQGPNTEQAGIFGLEIVYAQKSYEITPELRWPAWAIDRPVAGTRILTGEPICTVTGNAHSASMLRKLLCRRKQLICEVLSTRATIN